ncbi:hypothetical protein DITRI_Ditri13aG0116800 [Diplodiscus trichospermus]
MSAKGGAGASSRRAQQKDKHPADDQDGNQLFFRIKRTSQLRKLMTAYCDKQLVVSSAVVFLFDGRMLRGEQTPQEVNLHTWFPNSGLLVLHR